MAALISLHKALASDDRSERRDGLLQLALLLDDRISQLQAVRHHLDMAVQQMDRSEGRSAPDRRRALKSRHLRSAEDVQKGIEGLIAGD